MAALHGVIGRVIGRLIGRVITAVLLLAALGCTDPLTRGRETLARGDAMGAIPDLQRAIAADPEDPIAHEELARAHYRTGAADQALPAIERAVALAPESSRARLLRAQIHLSLGERDLARADALWVSEHAREVDVLEQVAVVWTRLGDGRQALAAGRAAIDRSEGAPASYANLAVLATELRAFEVAERTLAEGRKAHPQDVHLRVVEAAYWMARGRFTEATAAYEALLPLHPEPGLVHQALALLAHAAGDLEQAQRHADQAVAALGHDQPEVHYTRAVILRDRGRLDDARAAVTSARRRFPGNPELEALDLELAGDSPR